MNRREQRKNEASISAPVSSMIDIVFLLIIFFVVTIDIERDAADQEIKLPAIHDGKPLRIKRKEQLTVNVRKNGILTLNGQIINHEYFDTVIKAISQKWGTSYSIIIRADREVDFSETNKIVKALGKVGFSNVSFCAELKKAGKDND